MNRRALFYYYGLAFGITWGVGGLCLLASVYRPEFALSTANPLYYVAARGPSLAGFILVGRLEGWAGLRSLLARAVPSWRGLPWYGAVVVGFVVVHLALGGLTVPNYGKSLPRWDRFLYLLPLTLVTDPGPLGEEFGWRGFALPCLLRWRSPLAAALILGVVWAFWHLPAFFISTLSQSQLLFPVFVLNSMALSVMMTWLYLRTGGDLALMILVHLMANYCSNFQVPFNIAVVGEVACAALIVAAGGLRVAGLPRA